MNSNCFNRLSEVNQLIKELELECSSKKNHINIILILAIVLSVIILLIIVNPKLINYTTAEC
jgi:hypothetical protein